MNILCTLNLGRMSTGWASCRKNMCSENQVLHSKDVLMILMFHIICHDLSEIRRATI